MGSWSPSAQALEHPGRQAIVDLVRANPGIRLRPIARQAGMLPTTARHHLAVLRQAGLVAELRQGRAVLHFPGRTAPRDATPSWLLHDDALRTLHAWLGRNPGVSQRRILDAHPWSRSTTQHRLNRLVDAGLVACQAAGRGRTYYVQHQA